MEIERRFLLRPCRVERLLRERKIAYEAWPVEQFYLSADGKGVERYRRMGDRYIHTVKRGRGLVRQEWEEEVDAGLYARKKEENRGGLVEKTRYVFSLEGWTCELDAFKGRLKGLNILEIEFPSVEAAEGYELPELFRPLLVAEVTENAAFTNGALSRTLRIPAIGEPLEALSGRLEERREWLKASVKVDFGPYESGRHALQLILASLLRTVAANARAIREGEEEPERLHQLRVAMRKMRVLLGEFGGLFETGWVAEHRERLRELIRSTNDLRDAQVHRRELERYREMLPRRGRKTIDRLAEHLDREIARQREALVELLDSKAFRKEMEVLERFASTEGAEGFAPVADGPVIPAAKERLKRRFKKLRREGKRLGKKSPPEAYHELRIGVKKLRYLIEFCASILREEERQELLRRLKGLQTLLGEHQDRRIQSETLERLARSEEIGEKASREALRELAKRLEKEAAEYREAFPERFAPVAGSRKLLRRAICGF